MKRTRRTRRLAKQVFRLCLVNGLLDAGRVRGAVGRLTRSRNRDHFGVLKQFVRLVRLDVARHTATVKTAEPLPAEMRSRLQDGLARVYGLGLDTSFTDSPALIGGVRIRVGSDVYDGSVRGRLAALAARF
jgi:F-type H+-transporting ATPase subunit delta